MFDCVAYTNEQLAHLYLPIGKCEGHNWHPNKKYHSYADWWLYKYQCTKCKILGNLIVILNTLDESNDLEYFFEIADPNKYDKCGPRLKFRQLLA